MATHMLAHPLQLAFHPTHMLHFIAAYISGSRRGNQEQTAMNTAHRAIARNSPRGMFLSPIRFPQQLPTGLGLFFYPFHRASHRKTNITRSNLVNVPTHRTGIPVSEV